MAQYEGVTVKIISNREPCPMYDDPDADGHEDPFNLSSPPQKYIEVVTGAQFSIVVTLDNSFSFAGCDAVRVKAYYDAEPHGRYYDINRKNATGKGRSTEISTISWYCSESKQLQKGKLTFGELKIQDTSDSTVSLDAIKGLGRIRVSWQRIYFGKVTCGNYSDDWKGRKIISEVPEKVLKGKAIENMIKPGNPQAVSRSSYKHVKGIPMLGDAGRAVTVNILYRSKRILQMLGCIPRTPSPIPQLNNLEEAVIKPDDPQEQLRALRAQLTELENRINNTSGLVVKSEQLRSTSNVKREREDHENEVKSKRSRKSGSLEVVDLTAD